MHKYFSIPHGQEKKTHVRHNQSRKVVIRQTEEKKFDQLIYTWVLQRSETKITTSSKETAFYTNSSHPQSYRCFNLSKNRPDGRIRGEKSILGSARNAKVNRNHQASISFQALQTADKLPRLDVNKGINMSSSHANLRKFLFDELLMVYNRILNQSTAAEEW
jgi:hypothetical protein